MKQFLKLSILLFTLVAIITACEESDKFSSDSSLKLEFSADTLRFDTVFTTIPSPMQRVKVYNRNNNSISFESIELVNASTSGFRINVDGQSGTKFEDVDLLRKDSIYIMVDAKLNETKGTNILVEDAISLKWNGNTEYIRLGAYGVNVEVWDNKLISTNTRLSAEKGYYIKNSLTINEGVTLEVEAGATFYLDKQASITINGTIVAKGTPQKPITFRTHRFDMLERNILYDNASGQWQGITVGANSFDNIFENVRIRGSYQGLNFLPSTPKQQKATLINTIVHNTAEFGIKAVNAKIDAVNCQVSNSRGSLLNLIGGDYSFLHCTIANYYRWHARNNSSVLLNEEDKGVKYKFEKCDFKNSIIVGSMQTELGIYVNEAAPFSFNNCLIQALYPSEDVRFKKTIWNTDSPFLFKNLNENQRYIYSFELIEGSAAINTANAEFAKYAPLDLRGVSRTTNKPDIGAYEWSM